MVWFLGVHGRKAPYRYGCRGAAESMGSRLVAHKTWCFASVMAHSCRRCLSHSILHLSRWCGRRPKPGNKHQDVPEHEPRHGDLGHLKRNVAAVADDLRTDFDQLLAQAGQRPRLRRVRHRQRAHEVAEVVGQHMEPQADGIGSEGTARQPSPLDRTLSLFDSLLCCAAPVVEGD